MAKDLDLTPPFMRRPPPLPPPILEYKGHPTISKCAYCRQLCKLRELMVVTCPNFVEDPNKFWSRGDRHLIRKRMKIIDNLPKIVYRPPPPPVPGARHTKEGKEAWKRWQMERALERAKKAGRGETHKTM